MAARLGAALAALLLIGCSARERIRAGDDYMAAGRYAAAGRAYNKAADRRPHSSRALEGAAAAWLADGEPEQALTYARLATEQSPTGLPLLAETLIELGRGREAVSLLEEAPDTPGQSRWLAESLLSAGLLDAALSEAGTAEADEGGELAGLIGWLNARLGHDEDALSIAHRLQSAPSTQARADAVAIRMLLRDDPADGVATAVPTSELTRQWWVAAALMLETGEPEAALRRFMWLWANDPTDGRAARHAGELLVVLGDPAGARRALTASLSIDDSDLMLWLTLARACHALEDWQCSASARSRALALSESPTVEDWVLGARAWRAAGSMPELVSMWEGAIKRQPNKPTLYYHLSGTLMEAGRIDEAVGYARAAWNLAPQDAEVALLLGELYARREEYRSAVRVYEAALQSSPSDSRLHASLKTVLGYIPY
ncbi:MAG: tetratricopeptide (TPR) repeat protein [Myxococcota bacterium]|jgi:tetratricopeptide (TPR) repeat protein